MVRQRVTPREETHRGHDQKRLLPGEWPADAGAHTVAERLPGVRREVGETAIEHALGPECFGIVAPHGRVPVQGIKDHHDRIALLHFVLASQDFGVFDWRDGKGGGRRLEAQRLFECGVNVLELGQVFEANRFGAADTIYFLSNRSDARRVLE